MQRSVSERVMGVNIDKVLLLYYKLVQSSSKMYVFREAPDANKARIKVIGLIMTNVYNTCKLEKNTYSRVSGS